MTYKYNQTLKDRISRLNLAIIGILFALVIAAGSMSFAFQHANAATTTTVVTGNTVDTSLGENGSVGWWFDRDQSSTTPFEFNDDEASLGSGSLYVPPIGSNASDKFVAEYFYLDEIANVKSISFDFKTVNPADVQDFYMNLYVNDGSDPTEFYDCRYNVVPTTFTPGSNGFMTVSYNLSDATSVSQRGSSSILPCPSTPTDLPAGAVLRTIQLNVGQSTNSDIGTSGYLDNVVITEVSGSTAYDLEPTTTPTNKDECKKDGWKSFNTPVFKNQGQCVAYVQANGNASFKR